MTNSRNRNMLEVVVVLLETAREPVRKTHMLYKSNINYQQFRRYLDFMLKLELLEEVEQPVKGYKATEKGLRFLKEYSRVQYPYVVETEQSPVPLIGKSRGEVGISPAAVKSVLTHIKETITVSGEKQLNAFIVDEVSAGRRTIPKDLAETSNIVHDYLLEANIPAEIEVSLFIDKENTAWKTILLTIYVKDKTPEDILNLQHVLYSRIRTKIYDLSKCLLVRVLPNR